MCGFAGYLEPVGRGDGDPGRVAAMAARLTHRGPDDADVWLDPDAGVALGFRRLAILDLSHAGRQPMRSASGRYVVTFNGEIYNHLRLRSELGSGVAWRGGSDTETLLACIDRWGVERALERAVGMFAFALWDRSERVLTLARDRMGEKPCYYGRQGSTFLFASELKALKAHPAFRGDLDEDVLALYLRLGYVPAPHSIFRGIHKLLPGTLLRVPAAGAEVGPEDAVPYWSLTEVATAGARSPFAGTEREAVDELERLLGGAIADQRLADVPLGAFLSGGVDSSTVVALMQQQSTQPVRTFTIGFDDAASDESGHAAAVARHLGTEHVELHVTADDAMHVAPRLPEMYDEPFADASAIPTFLVAQLARRDVTVALSGDGGDELFAGYERHARALRLHDAVERVPRPLRRVAAGALGAVPSRAVGGALTALSIGTHPYMFASRVDTLRRALAAEAFEPLFMTQLSLWRDPAAVMQRPPKPVPSILFEPGFGLPAASRLDRMLHADSLTYLPDDVLVKVDRAAMAVSLETRVPLLDHRIVEFAWSLPEGLKRRGGVGKWVLRQVLARHVPNGLVDRPKQGFGAPTGAWVRGGLRDWAEEALSEARLRDDGLLRPDVVRALWAQHLAGRHDWKYRLWPLIVLQHWLRAQRA